MLPAHTLGTSTTTRKPSERNPAFEPARWCSALVSALRSSSCGRCSSRKRWTGSREYSVYAKKADNYTVTRINLDNAVSRPRSVLIGLIGHGVAPSLTPPMHEMEGARHGLHYVYRPIDVEHSPDEAGTLAEVVAAARRMCFDGLNITHPYKQLVLPLLDELRGAAEWLGAVNTVQMQGDRLVGYNTDVSGFGRAFKDALSDAPRERVVLLGAGGAGTAVAAALVEQGVAELSIVDIDLARAEALAALLNPRTNGVVSGHAIDDLAELVPVADGFVNATPFGMASNPGSGVDVALLHDGLWVADIVYRPTETVLLKEARRRGLRTMSGLGMVMAQAADAFEIFTGERADRSLMLTDLQALVAAEAD